MSPLAQVESGRRENGGQRWDALMDMDRRMRDLRLQHTNQQLSVEQQLALSSQRLAMVESAYKQAQASCSVWDQELQSAEQELKQAQEQLGHALTAKKEVSVCVRACVRVCVCVCVCVCVRVCACVCARSNMRARTHIHVLLCSFLILRIPLLCSGPK